MKALDAPMVFIIGPHGSGKSTLGQSVSSELGLRFVDLPDAESADLRLEELLAGRTTRSSFQAAPNVSPNRAGICSRDCAYSPQ